MRPGCDRPAEARLSYDTISCQVWLDQMPDRLGPVQEICQFHAARLTVPRGWRLNDRRVDLHAPDEAVPRRSARRDPLASSDVAVSAVVVDPVVVDPVVVDPVVVEPVVLEPAALQPVTRVLAAAVPRRTNRRRHPSSSARQLFDDVVEPRPSPVVQTGSDPEPDLDADLDLDLDAGPDELGDQAAEVESIEPVAIPEAPEVPEVPEARELPGHAQVMAAISVDVEDDLPESLRATSPLLSRAFRATGPQRSVLSEDLARPGPDAGTD